MATNQAKNPRIAFFPSDAVAALISELSEASRRSKALIVAELLDDIAPVLRGQLEAMKKIAARPEEARAHIEALAAAGIVQIAQAQIDFDAPRRVRGPDRKKRARRAARAAT